MKIKIIGVISLAGSMLILASFASGGNVRTSTRSTEQSQTAGAQGTNKSLDEAGLDISSTAGQSTPSSSHSRDPLTGEEINWQVVSSGGTDGSSVSFKLTGTAGQTATGKGSSTSFGLAHGFWQDFPTPPEYVCGDANASGAVDIDDVVYLIAFIFTGGPSPIPYESGDANCSGAVDIDDVVWLIGYIFTGGNAPCDINGDTVPDC